MTRCFTDLQLTGGLEQGQAEFRESFPLFSTPLQCPFTRWEPWEVRTLRSPGHVPSQSAQQWPRSSNATFDAGTEQQLQESQPALGPASHPQPQQLGMSPLLLPGAEEQNLPPGSCCEDGENVVGHSAEASEPCTHRTSLRTVLCPPSWGHAT